MKIFKNLWLTAVAVGLFAVGSANAQVNFSFDSAHSNVGEGLYAFDLTGVPAIDIPLGSTYEISLLGFIDLGSDPISSPPTAPPGWSWLLNGGEPYWFFDQPSGDINGIFAVQAAPNLSGSLAWGLYDNSAVMSPSLGTVTIPAPSTPVPEPAPYAFMAIAVAGLMISTMAGGRRSRPHVRSGSS